MRILVLTLIMSFLSHSALGASSLYFDIHCILTITTNSAKGGGAEEADALYAPKICLQVPDNSKTIEDLLRCFKKCDNQSQTTGGFDVCRGVFNKVRLPPKKW